MEGKDNLEKYKIYIPYIIFFVLMIVLHILGYKVIYDDKAVAENQTGTLLDLLKNLGGTYQNWSSRVIINPVIWIVYRFGRVVWTILDALILTFIFKGINYICFKEKNVRNTYILLMLMLQFPLYIVTTAGWVVTTITYVWTAAAAIGACYSIRYYLDNERISISRTVLLCLFTVFATNKEELSVMLFIIFGFMFALSIRNKNISLVFAFQFAISVFGVLFHLFSTDNQARIESTEVTDMGFSTLDKLELGFSSTFFHMFVDFDMFTAGFCLLLAVMVTIEADKLYKKLVGWIPFLVWIAGCLGEEKQLFGLYVREDYSSPFDFPDYFTNGKYLTLTGWGQLILLLFTVTMIIMSVIMVNKTSVTTLILSVVLIGGYCGRMVVGFGENCWLPYSRTYTFFYLGMILTLDILICKVMDKLTSRKRDAFIYLLIGITIFELFFNVIKLGVVDVGV